MNVEKNVAITVSPRGMELAGVLKAGSKFGDSIWSKIRACFVDGESFLTVEEAEKVAAEARKVAKANGWMKGNGAAVYLSNQLRALRETGTIHTSRAEFNKWQESQPKRTKTKGTEEAQPAESAPALGASLIAVCEKLDAQPAEVLEAAEEAYELGADIVVTIRAALKRGVSREAIKGAIIALSGKAREEAEEAKPEPMADAA